MTVGSQSHKSAYGRFALVALLLGLFLCVAWVFRASVLKSNEDMRGDLARHPALRAQRTSNELDAFFASPEIPQIVLELEESEADKLRSDARAYVKCKLRENDGEPMRVGIKLKGAAGSFRELDDRPAFTVNVNKYRKQQRYHLLEKFYLNNSVQDESYYSEWLCAEICRKLRLPAPRIAFAHVWVNDRDLGLYVLKEGFDEAFIARHFREAGGSLYDGGFLQDIDVDLEKDLGSPPDDLSDLHRLRAACFEADLQKQRTDIQQSLDLDAFLAFMAFESMACHWDGYVANKNNYRLYFPPGNRAWFLPHGMDQMFQDPDYPVFEPRETLVTRAVRNQPDWNDKYRQRVRKLLPLFEPDSLIASLEQLEKRLRPELIKLDPECGPTRDDLLAQWRERLTRRHASIVEQLEQPDPPPPIPEPSTEEALYLAIDESITLNDWYSWQETPSSILLASEQEIVVHRIEVGEADDCIASWRRSVRLPPGNYRFSVELRGDSIKPREQDDRGMGAGVRISGSSRSQGLSDTFEWQITHYDFTVETQVESQVEQPAAIEPQANATTEVRDETVTELQGEMASETPAIEDLSQIELVSELRATAGWSEMRSPTLTRLPQ